jgi:hypothetical protein
MLERDVKKSLKEYLKKLGAKQFWPVPTGFGATTVDCLFCYEGRMFAVETKRPGVDKATPMQERELQEWANAGALVCLENDPELPKVRALIATVIP